MGEFIYEGLGVTVALLKQRIEDQADRLVKLWFQVWIVVQPTRGERDEYGVRRLGLEGNALTLYSAADANTSLCPYMPLGALQTPYPYVWLLVRREQLAALGAMLRLKLGCGVPILKEYAQKLGELVIEMCSGLYIREPEACYLLG